MGSRLHGNDGAAAGAPHNRHSHNSGNPRPHNRHSHNSGNPRPHIVIPATAGIHGGGRRWVPVSTGTTGRRRAHPQSSFPQQRESTVPHRHSRDGGNPRRGAGDGFPSPRERRAGGGRTHNRHSHNSGNPRQPHRHSRDGGNPRGGPAMGSRLHGNDEPAAAHPTIVIPATAGIHGSHIVIPATAGIHGGGPAMGSRLHGNDGPAVGAPTIVIPTTAGIHGSHIVIPATAGIHGGGGRRWVPVSTGTTSRRRAHPQSSFPQQRESTGGAGDGFPSPRERRAGGGRTPQSSFPRRRGSRDPGARPPPPSFTVGSLASRVESTRHSGPRAGIQGWGGQARWRAAAADAWLTSGRLQRLAPPTCPCRLFHRDPAVTSMRPCTAGLW